MFKFKIFVEKNDTWHELGIFEGKSKEEAIEAARKSDFLLEYYNEDEITYANLEAEKLES